LIFLYWFFFSFLFYFGPPKRGGKKKTAEKQRKVPTALLPDLCWTSCENYDTSVESVTDKLVTSPAKGSLPSTESDRMVSWALSATASSCPGFFRRLQYMMLAVNVSIIFWLTCQRNEITGLIFKF